MNKIVSRFIDHVHGKIELSLFLLRVAGLVYFPYHLWLLDVELKPAGYFNFFSGNSHVNSRTALILLFAGIFGLILLLAAVLLVFKFIHNIFKGLLDKIFPVSLHSIATSIAVLSILWLSSLFSKEIKVVCLKSYYQASEAVSAAKRHNPKFAPKIVSD